VSDARDDDDMKAPREGGDVKNAPEDGDVKDSREDDDARDSSPDDSGPDSAPDSTPDPAARPARAESGAGSGSGLAGFWAFLRETYGSADPRSLGLFRIALSCLLFVDVARRWPDIEAHYSNLGWLTNHYALFRPMSSHLFSVYLAFSTPAEVKVMMGIHLFIIVLLAIGFRTRLMHVLVAILTVSIEGRNIMLENGGWVVLTELVIWSMFLPLGRRFSVDALLASLRARRETTPAALNDRTSPARDTAPVVSLAVAALIFQWVVIYYFNVVHKSGREWRDGTAVYYFFQQDRMVTDLGAWVREYIPFFVYRVMTYSTLVIESLIALLLASPFRTPLARMVAWVLCASLHLSIDAVVQLGPFSWAMVTMFWVLIPREAWDHWGPRLAGRYPLRELCFDAASGFWVSFCRVVKRLDVLEHVKFVPVSPPASSEDDDDDDEEEEDRDAAAPVAAASEQGAPGDALARAVGRSLVVVDPKDGARHQGLGALLRLADAIPFGTLLVLPVRVPGISEFVERRLERRAKDRREADAYYEVEALPGSPEAFAPAPSAAARFFDRGRMLTREAAVALLVVSCGSQVLIENRAVPKWLKPEHRPDWMTALVVYPRMFQGWSMFAPSPPADDGRMVVDGVTKDGRKLDPLTGQAPSFEVQPKEGFRMNQIWGDFHRRIGEQRFEGYLEGVREMLKNYHLITGRKEDELRSFDVWFVAEHIPLPWQPRKAADRRKVLSWGTPDATINKRRPPSRPGPNRPPRP